MKRLNKITTEQDVRKVLSYMTDTVGMHFRPHDPVDGYLRGDGTPMFTEEESVHIHRLLMESSDFCCDNDMDIYDMAQDLFREVHGEACRKAAAV